MQSQKVASMCLALPSNLPRPFLYSREIRQKDDAEKIPVRCVKCGVLCCLWRACDMFCAGTTKGFKRITEIPSGRVHVACWLHDWLALACVTRCFDPCRVGQELSYSSDAMNFTILPSVSRKKDGKDRGIRDGSLGVVVAVSHQFLQSHHAWLKEHFAGHIYSEMRQKLTKVIVHGVLEQLVEIDACRVLPLQRGSHRLRCTDLSGSFVVDGWPRCFCCPSYQEV